MTDIPAIKETLAVTSVVAASLQAADRRELERQDPLWAAGARGRDALLPVGEVASFMVGAVVTFDGADRAEVTYRLFHAAKGANPGVPPAFDCRDKLRRGDGVWRIVERSAQPFEGDAMAYLDALAAQVG